MTKLIIILALAVGGMKMAHNMGYNLDNVPQKQMRMLANI